jgi:cysteinyl-tRNA synthetase
VYDSAHLGHARTYVCSDIMRRVLTDYFRVDVNMVLGMTDVDDKIIKRARESDENWLDLARRYEAEFLEDLDTLNVRPPTAITRVTEHIDDIVAYISTIEEKGLAYSANDGVYFDTSSFGNWYGKLGPEMYDIEKSEGAQASTDAASTSGKRHERDFALWKLAKEGEPFWPSPWGDGRPGWHIECSAMTHSMFGPSLSLHTGGIDLAFPHHCNEIAQCEAHNGVEGWCSAFAHTGHLHIDGLKMSKSLKNFITIREYLEQYDVTDQPNEWTCSSAQSFRLFCLMHKYSSTVHFGQDRIRDSRNVFSRFARFKKSVGEMSNRPQAPKRWTSADRDLHAEFYARKREIRTALATDFDTGAALTHLQVRFLAHTQNHGSLISHFRSDMQRLVSMCNPHVSAIIDGGDSSSVSSVALVHEIADYVFSMLDLFGLDLKANGSALIVENAVGSEQYAGTAVLDEIAGFRSKVRRAALDSKHITSEAEAGEKKPNDLANTLLQYCDELRAQMEQQGVQLHDSSRGQHRWNFASPEPPSPDQATQERGVKTTKEREEFAQYDDLVRE